MAWIHGVRKKPDPVTPVTLTAHHTQGNKRYCEECTCWLRVRHVTDDNGYRRWQIAASAKLRVMKWPTNLARLTHKNQVSSFQDTGENNWKKKKV
jgi:hypothetical protein